MVSFRERVPKANLVELFSVVVLLLCKHLYSIPLLRHFPNQFFKVNVHNFLSYKLFAVPSFCYTILQYKQKGTECLKRHQIVCFHGSVAPPPLTECSFNIYDKVFFVQTTSSLLQDTYCEEMYNLDNDSFLNSLENVVIPPHSSLSIRTCSTNSNSRGTPSSAGSTDQSISILSNSSSTQSHRGIMSRFDSEA